MDRYLTRRAALRGAAVGGAALAGCVDTPGRGPLVSESFETGMRGWRTGADVGPEVSDPEFEWRIERSRERAADGEWSLEVFTEGDHDDGTAWVVTELSPPRDVSSFAASVRAWSPSESFNTLRHLVAYLGPDEPTEEGDFPDPGTNSSTVGGATYGGLREPLHLAEGWREYAFDWQPPTVPGELYFAVGVSVVWEADATHYVDAIEVTAG